LPIIALYFTTSRGGVVALITSIVAFLLFLYFKSKVFRKVIEKQSNILIFGLIIAATIFLIITARKVSPNQGGDSIRLDIYRYSITMVKENPVFGIGLGSFQQKIDQISATDANFQQFGIPYALHPHNLFLAMWLNLGLAGLAVFIILLWQIIQNLFKDKTEPFLKSCIFATLIAVLVHGLFDTTYFKNDLSAIFWLIFAMSFIILNKTKS
jgi:O-antigen ligase